jgi:hypothetical protein
MVEDAVGKCEDDFVVSVAVEVEELVLSAIIRHDLSELVSVGIDDPYRALAAWAMVDVDKNLGFLEVRKDAAYLYGFEMMARQLPADLAVAVDAGDVVGGAAGYCETPLLGAFAFSQYAAAVKVTLFLVDFLALELPSDGAIVIEHCVAGHDFVSAVAVDINGDGLMCGS